MSEQSLTPFYRGWEEYQRLLIAAIAPLTPEQLAFVPGPGQRPLWLNIAHIIGTRAGWFHFGLKEGDAAFVAYEKWDLEGAPVRTAAELVEGLERTWRVLADCFDRWTPAMLDDVFPRDREGETMTRQWVIWHVLEHDLHHGGEVSLTLGLQGLAAPDL